jgi:thiamine pyrophosphokinase
LLLVRDEIVIEGCVGDVVSLVALSGDVVGVRMEGLEYALSGGTLKFGAARGVSNVLVARQARVEIRDGLLLLVHHHQVPSGGVEPGPLGECDE